MVPEPFTDPRELFDVAVRQLGDFTVGDLVTVTDVDDPAFGARGWISGLAPNVWDDNDFVRVVLTRLPEGFDPAPFTDWVFTLRQLAKT